MEDPGKRELIILSMILSYPIDPALSRFKKSINGAYVVLKLFVIIVKI